MCYHCTHILKESLMQTAESAAAQTQSRLNIRIASRDKQIVERAASASHMTTSQFVKQAALRSAEEVLADQTRFVLPAQQWAAFTEALDRPARVIPALRSAAAKPSPFSGR